jgi:glycerol kinase
MTAHTSKAQIARAAEESIAYQIRDALDAMRAESKIKLRNLHADGGPTRDKFLMQFSADITRVEFRVAEVAESSAWGAAMNGLLALKICRSLDDFERLPRRQKIFRPRMNSKLVEQNYSGWNQAVKRVL